MEHNNYTIDDLISAKAIAARVESMAKEISEFFDVSESNPDLVADLMSRFETQGYLQDRTRKDE